MKKPFTLLGIVLLGFTAFTAGANSEKITHHDQLQEALKENQPPSGYIDLNRCSTAASIGSLPEDKQTYRLSFKDHFSFNLQSKIITSVVDMVMNSSEVIDGTPILIKVPATIFVTSSPKNNFLRYQISIENERETWVRVYHCPWDKAVYLWR
ncbi:hypothetical protein [Endozoicomonas sp. Mp262]|uniref:hypothetical protein n=1 Tax=Endozoicomonas sp. Mp262 TaxID=2919499 RepID=UPI0021DFBBEB